MIQLLQSQVKNLNIIFLQDFSILQSDPVSLCQQLTKLQRIMAPSPSVVKQSQQMSHIKTLCPHLLNNQASTSSQQLPPSAALTWEPQTSN